MQTVHKPRRRIRGRTKNGKGSSHVAPAAGGQQFPAAAAGNPAVKSRDDGVWLTACARRQGLSAFHVAYLKDELARVQHLAWSTAVTAKAASPPIYMILSSRSAPKTAASLRFLLQFDAAVDMKAPKTPSTTPLHQAATAGLLNRTEILVKAGADVLARDNTGHTPWDLARIWGHRKVARYLKNCMWQAEKKKETKERTLIRNLYRELVELVKQKRLEKKALIDETISQWEDKKGISHLKEMSYPQSTKALYHHPGRGPPQPSGPTTRPWTVFQGLQHENSLNEPDLRTHVFLTWDRDTEKLQFCTEWDRTPLPAPDLPLDVLERALFPRNFLSRLVWPHDCQPQEVDAILHRRRPKGTSSSPWTEVAMHLAEVLEPGHY